MTQSATPPESAASTKLPYPIVEMQGLQRPGRTGPWKLGPRSRPEIPRPRQGHFVLVYKVNNRYFVDNMNLGPRDDKVINASQVSIVDLGKQTPIEVELTLDSQDHSHFTVVVTFGCSVVDPVAVVEGGITDPGAILLTYLKNHHGYSQMGLGFRIGQVNEARRYIDAQLTAYATVNEPAIEGMTVTMASVEVRTPEEERNRAAAQRNMRDRHALESERVDIDSDLQSQRQRTEHIMRRTGQNYEHEVLVSAQDNEQELRISGQGNDQQYDIQQRRHRRLVEDEEQLHAIRARQIAREAEEEERLYTIQARRVELEAELARSGMTEEYRLSGLREAAQLLGDPLRALQLAYLAGELDAGTLAERMRAGKERDHEIERAAADQRQAAERERRRDEATDRRETLAFEREQKRAELEAKRAEAQQRAEEARHERELDRERERAQMIWQRQDEVAQHQASQEREQRIYKAKVDMGRALVDRGLVDTESVNLEGFLHLDSAELPLLGMTEAVELKGEPAPPTVASDAQPDDRQGGGGGTGR